MRRLPDGFTRRDLRGKRQIEDLAGLRFLRASFPRLHQVFKMPLFYFSNPFKGGENDGKKQNAVPKEISQGEAKPAFVEAVLR